MKYREDDSKMLDDAIRYGKVLVKLIYLILPHICIVYVVDVLNQFMQEPLPMYEEGALHNLAYIK